MTAQRFNVDALPGYATGRSDVSVAAAVSADGRIFLSAQSALNAQGEIAGAGDPVAQTEAALGRIASALAAAGGSLADIAKLTVHVVDRAHCAAVHAVISRRLAAANPVCVTLVVAGLARPELLIQLDAEAVTAGAQDVFARAQPDASGAQPNDPAAQAERALSALAQRLREGGSGMDDVCKITVYITDRAHRPDVYPVIGKYFRGIHPVSTGIIVPGFAQADALFDIDAVAVRKHGGAPHVRVRPYHSSVARYGTEQQPLDCDFCMAVRAGRRVILRGQTGVDLDEVMRGKGDAVAQARQAMNNVAILLGDAGARLSDVVKVTVFVTDRAWLGGVSEAVLQRLAGVAPAFSALVVKGLASAELLMEVDITAVIAEPGV